MDDEMAVLYYTLLCYATNDAALILLAFELAMYKMNGPT